MTLGIEGRPLELIIRQNTSDTQLVGQIFMDTAFDLRRLRRFEEVMEFQKTMERSGKRPLIVDAGANIGLTSVYFSAQCKDALIVAVEPEPANFAVLHHNVSGLPVIPVPCAIAASPQKMVVVDPGEGEWGHRAEPVGDQASTGVEVDCITIGEIFRAHQDECYPFIVKADIEGGEDELFSRNTDWIEQTPILIVELHDWLLPKKRTAHNFLRTICDLDRDFIYIGENVFSISNNFPSFYN